MVWCILWFCNYNCGLGCYGCEVSFDLSVVVCLLYGGFGICFSDLFVVGFKWFYFGNGLRWFIVPVRLVLFWVLEYCAYLLNSVVLIRCMFYFVCVFIAWVCLLC